MCRYKDVEIIDGAVCEDHIHLSVAIPPKYSISKFMGYLKGKSTLMIYDRHMLNKYQDYRIICLDKLTYAGNLSTLVSIMDNPNFHFVKESIADREAVYRIFEEEKPDMVVNFSAESHVDSSIENPEIFLDTNIKGMAVLKDACRNYGIRRYHQASTDEVYGDLSLDRLDLFFTEETPIHTSGPYSSSKAGVDLMVLAHYRTYGLPVIISRCSNN